MMFYPMWFDSYYLLLVVVPLLIGIWAQAKVSSTFKKYSSVGSASVQTGAQMARRILDANGLHDIGIQQVSGNLTDHYDPKAGVIRLSDGVYNSVSIAAIGVAAHECGHAIQKAAGYFPMKIRSAIVPLTNIGSKLAIPLILVGFLFSFQPLVMIGLIGYALIALFQLVTLPVEFNASSRALSTIREMGAGEEEQRGIKKVLGAAAMTYVASLISAITQFVYLFVRYGRRNARR